MLAMAQIEDATGEAERLRKEFFGWQCRVRQIAMRKAEGQPDDSIMPEVYLSGSKETSGQIIIMICKKADFSQMPEFQHMARKTADQGERRKKAVEFLSSTYYQKPDEFSDTLTATFVPDSPGAKDICASPSLTLVFEAYGQRFNVVCKARQMASDDPLYQATWAHNFLFNPGLSPKAIIVGFDPDWSQSTVETGGSN